MSMEEANPWPFGFRLEQKKTYPICQQWKLNPLPKVNEIVGDIKT